MLLDKVQKKKLLTPTEAKYLKGRKFIEGRKPNYYFSLNLSQEIGEKANYSKNKALEKTYYLELIKKCIKDH
jgi:ATP-dependent DNA helicase RecG